MGIMSYLEKKQTQCTTKKEKRNARDRLPKTNLF